MKLFVAVITVAVLIMFVFAQDTAAAINDFEDTKDMGSSSGLFGGLKYKHFFSSSSGSSGNSSKSSSKNPIYDLVKSVIKLLTKVFSDSEISPPVVVLAMFAFSQWSTAASSAVFTYPTEKPKTPVTPQLLRNDYVYDNNGQFNLNYQVDDGTSQTREGTLVLNDEGDDYVLIQKGSYSYISPEGIKVTVTYTADKEGFKIVESSNEVPARV
ncbi:hypothetical protein QTP88_012618 [Uroleucon formosanum]